MTELNVINTNPRIKLLSRFLSPISSLVPSYTRNLFRVYTNNNINNRNYIYRKNIFIKKKPLFK